MFSRKFSIAPMMEYTDKHFRYLIRLLTRNAVLFTEMIHANAILYGDQNNLLAYHEVEHPVVLQLGGSEPVALAQAAKIAEKHGYDEINLNVGCPSNAVVKGNFGASLMLQPNLVSEIVKAIQDSVNIPVSIKCRIGVDDYDDYGFLRDFVGKLVQQGCDIFYIHARKAILQGLSPKENRNIPSLKYERVFQLKKDFPDIFIAINGGINNVEFLSRHVNQIDGIMLGREAYSNPYIFADLDQKYYQATQVVLSREVIVEKYLDYAKQQPEKLFSITKHLQGLWKNQTRARLFRRIVTNPKVQVEEIIDFLQNSEC